MIAWLRLYRQNILGDDKWVGNYPVPKSPNLIDLDGVCGCSLWHFPSIGATYKWKS